MHKIALTRISNIGKVCKSKISKIAAAIALGLVICGVAMAPAAFAGGGHDSGNHEEHHEKHHEKHQRIIIEGMTTATWRRSLLTTMHRHPTIITHLSRNTIRPSRSIVSHLHRRA